MLTIGTLAIFHSAFYREARGVMVEIVRALSADESDDQGFRVRRRDGTTFSAFAWELTAL